MKISKLYKTTLLNLLLFSLFVVVGNKAYAQKKEWGFEISNYLNLSSTLPKSDHAYSDKFKGSETYRVSNGISFSATLRQNERLKYAAGIGVLYTGDKSNLFEPDPLRGFFFGRTYQTRLINLEIPLMLEYRVAKPIVLQFGISGFYAVSKKLELVFDNSANDALELTTTNNFGDNLDASLNFGIGYSKVSDGIGFHLIPYGQFHLRKIKSISSDHSDLLAPRQFYSLGLKAGISF